MFSNFKNKKDEKNFIAGCFIFFSACLNAYAQNDTTYAYQNLQRENCDESIATYQLRIFAVGDLWHKQTFEMKTGKLMQSNVYIGSYLRILQDTSKNHDEPDGEILESIYDHGNLLREQIVNKQNKILGYSVYEGDEKIIEQKGFDENGNEISNYIFFTACRISQRRRRGLATIFAEQSCLWRI